ncbi:YfhO family protein [Butyrivibrio sp. FCS014]|uniref:YfhO family protein n=1 Tax=Butyrivibrio sp. FCS014 TaxID=1408304 RepID=UPI000466D8FA|nr:YfhO family protein [Butyrivibrio sp. FCS014]
MEKSLGEHKFNIIQALFASALVMALFVVLSVFCRITPFGDNTFLMGDLKRQYVDYYAYLRTIMSGENNGVYSFSTTLGSGIVGFFAYYLSSPFLVLLNLFPQTAVPVGISVIICLKLMVAAFVMEMFLQRFVNGDGILLCSVSWAFSGYLFAHSMNMMWMDVVIMLPLAVWALEHILDKNRKAPYIIVLSLMLLFNYYITYQVLLFLAMWTVVRVIVRDDDRKFLQMFRVFAATVAGILIDGMLLLPTALELMNSPKDIAQLGLRLTGKNLDPVDLFSKAISCAYDALEARSGYPQIFCGVLLIFLLVLYFLDRKIPLRERLGMLALFFVLLVSFCFDILNLVWHAGMEPSGHPYRQAFLWTFMVVVCSARALVGIRDSLYYRRIIGIFAMMSILLMLVARKGYDHAPKETIILNFALAGVYSLMLCLLIRFEAKDLRKLTAVMLAGLFVVNMGDLVLNARYTYHFQSANAETASFFSEAVRNNLAAVNYIKGKDSSFYRMENLDPRQQNDALQYNYNGVTHYSSAGMIYVRYFLQRLGFNDDGLYTAYGHDNTALADMLLGIRYVIDDNSVNAHSDYEKIYDAAVSAYENPRPLSVAVETTDFDLSKIIDPDNNEPDADLIHVPKMDAFSLQEEVLSRILGKETSVFEPAKVQSSDIIKSDNNKYYIDHAITPARDGELYMYLDGLIGAAEGLSVYVDGEFLTTYGNASCVKILNLGYRSAGDHILVRVEGEKKSDYLGEAKFVTENTDTLNAAFDELREKNSVITKKSSSRLFIETGECNGIFTTIPYESGWKVKVDGKETEPIAVYDCFMYIPIEEEGESHIVTMAFASPGQTAGYVVSILGVILTASLIIPEILKKRAEKTGKQA